jgi:Zn finger protein HypA/HybF involved in hydrogenase expression
MKYNKYNLECVRCGNKWEAREEVVNRCPKCKDVNYDIPIDIGYLNVVRLRKYEGGV